MNKKIDVNGMFAKLNQVKEVTEKLANTSRSELIETDLIFPSKDNPYNRQDTPEIVSQLATTIEAIGLIHPLTVRKINDECYEIISGERRYKAIKTLGWKKIPCTVYDNLSDDKAQLMLHVANLETREYTPGEKLQFYPATEKCIKKLISSGEYTGTLQQGIAEMLKISDRQVRKYKKILENLDEAEHERIIKGDESINTAYKKAVEEKEAKAENQEKRKEKEKKTNEENPLVQKLTDFYLQRIFSETDEITKTCGISFSDEQLEKLGHKLNKKMRKVISDCIREVLK